MSATITKINVMKMQHVQIQMVITLVPVMMDLWVMVPLVQVCEFIITTKRYQFLFKYFRHLINYHIPDNTHTEHYAQTMESLFFFQISMNVRIIRVSVIKMQHVQIQMVFILVPVTMD